MKNEVHIRVSIKFKRSLDRLFPLCRSTRLKTEMLNEKLEEFIYGPRKKS